MEDKNSQNGQESKGGKKTNKIGYVQLLIIGILILVIGFYSGKISGGNSSKLNGAVTGLATVSAAEIIPTGTPEVYGKELGVKYDDVSATNSRLADSTIRKLKKYEDTKLNNEQMKRYIKIGSSISCEYCCGAKSLIFSDGKRACGCAHSYAMRGLSKYLLVNHPEMGDEEILSELGKWKVLFFPGIHQQKAKALEAQGIDSKDYINLASNLYRGIEKGQSSGEMVGGC